MSSTTQLQAAKFRVDALLTAMPYAERKEKSAQLNKEPGMRNLLSRLRRAVWSDSYSPPSDKLMAIAIILGCTVEELYNSNPEPDQHLPA